MVRAALIVIGDPRIEIGLQLIDAAIDLLAKSNPIELVQRGLVEPLANSVGLGPFGPRP